MCIVWDIRVRHHPSILSRCSLSDGYFDYTVTIQAASCCVDVEFAAAYVDDGQKIEGVPPAAAKS